jgi:hypothetical protein
LFGPEPAMCSDRKCHGQRCEHADAAQEQRSY